jgi:hypothetical protein
VDAPTETEAESMLGFIDRAVSLSTSTVSDHMLKARPLATDAAFQTTADFIGRAVMARQQTAEEAEARSAQEGEAMEDGTADVFDAAEVKWLEAKYALSAAAEDMDDGYTSATDAERPALVVQWKFAGEPRSVTNE